MPTSHLRTRRRVLRTPFSWYGGKHRLFPHLIRLIPPHDIYVSVFGGGASDIVRKPRSRAEILNDANQHIVSYFSVLQNDEQRAALCRRLRSSPYSRLLFRRAIEVVKHGPQDPVEQAWA